MQNFTILFVLINFLAIGCGIETVNIGEKKSEESTDDNSNLKEEEPSEVVVETETTTKTKVTVGGREQTDKGSRQLIAKYELRNSNQANTEFIGANYCAGSEIRDCWIRSGLMSEFSDGTFEVSIEMWDTYDSMPYKVESGKISGEHAFLLTDKAKSIDDESTTYKMLWAVVEPDMKAVGIFYDWGNDGPNEQGDDMLDALEFFEVDSED